ncbi:MAG: hypothetical protein MHM6MM_007894 [Cercozoa sp. M6MM]
MSAPEATQGKTLVLEHAALAATEKNVSGDVVTFSQHSDISKCSDGDYETVLLQTDAVSEGSLLAEVLRVLQAGGKLRVQSSTKTDDWRRALLYAGFLDVEQVGDEWLGKKAEAVVRGTLNKIGAAWSLGATDDVFEELADEDELLLNEAQPVQVESTKLDDCETGPGGRRKACKDCTCGRAEELEQEAVADNAPAAKKSSCGSCYLGDAFRCASCPYLGQPAFAPGDEVKLQL